MLPRLNLGTNRLKQGRASLISVPLTLNLDPIRTSPLTNRMQLTRLILMLVVLRLELSSNRIGKGLEEGRLQQVSKGNG